MSANNCGFSSQRHSITKVINSLTLCKSTRNFVVVLYPAHPQSWFVSSFRLELPPFLSGSLENMAAWNEDANQGGRPGLDGASIYHQTQRVKVHSNNNSESNVTIFIPHCCCPDWQFFFLAPLLCSFHILTLCVLMPSQNYNIRSWLFISIQLNHQVSIQLFPNVMD